MADGSTPRPPAEGRLVDARYHGDEVSLRELYLVFRAGLPAIVAFALVCALIAFLIVSLRPDAYEATATVNVIPPFVGTDSLSGLELSVTAGIDEQSYREIAFAPALLEAVGAPFDYSATEVFALLSLETRQAPSQARGHLVIDHSASVPGELGLEQADGLADAWAASTVTQVADALSRHLEGAVATVTAEIDARRAEFQAASDAWGEFIARDRRDEIRSRLASGSGDAGTSVDTDDAELRARLAALEAEAAALERQLSTASLVYYRVAPTGPALELQRDLVAGSAFVAIPASAPVKADAPGRAVVTVATALVAALAATLAVFLRAAVRER